MRTPIFGEDTNELWVLHIELSILTEKEPRTLQASKLNCRKLISQQG